MGFFNLFKIFNNDIAIDLGTANTLIWQNGKIVLNEPSMIAIEGDRVRAIGKDALSMLGRTPAVDKDFDVIRPMKDGVIATPHMAEELLKRFITNTAGNFIRRVVVCVPAGVTDAEKRNIRDSCEHAGAKEVYLIAEPIAAAIGIGLDVQGTDGIMIVDIGGGTTEIATIALGGIVCERSIKVAGNVMTDAILQYLKNKHELIIGEVMADNLKCAAGTAFPLKETEGKVAKVKGKNVINGLPIEKEITLNEIREEALKPHIDAIVTAIKQALEATPPELASDIFERGIFLSGGGALMPGMKERIEADTKLKVSIAPSPLESVVLGTGKVLSELNKYRDVCMRGLQHRDVSNL